MNVKNIRHISKEDALIAGGKGASLGEMTQAGIAVPPGFVVLSEVFEEFIRDTDLNVQIEAELDMVNLKTIHTVEKASEVIQSLILSHEIPGYIQKEILINFDELGADLVAVRSSATSEDSADAAWAGQLDSFLNTNKNALLQNIKKCWASLFTPRAIFYRFEKELHKENISVAVVVQKMIQSDESGIAFSVHPVTEDENQIIIEAGFGLGEAIVSGAITPDSYVVDKRDYSIVDININNQSKALYGISGGGNEWMELGIEGEKQVLTETEVVELSKMIAVIEAHYGFPCDIEWARKDGELYITQSRPITTLKNTTIKKNGIKEQIEDVGWMKTIKREFDLFIFSASIEANHSFMKNEIGICFEKILYRYKNKFGTIYDSPQETSYISKSLKEILLQDKELIENLLNKERELHETEIPTDPKKLIDFFVEVMLYNTILPYRLMLAIENSPEFNKYLPILNKIRATGGMYPELYFHHIKPLIYKLAKQAGINNKLWGLLSYDEIIQLIDGEDNINEEDLRKRKMGCWIYMVDGAKGINYENLDIEQEETVTDTQADTIKGSIANKGKVQGVVKIVNSIEQIKKIHKGEVLVSISTNPSLMPAIKKAAAIVTDEGGIISHAAIISRELNTPCIIGTKIATSVLCDGDLVEVDADNGVVRVLVK